MNILIFTKNWLGDVIFETPAIRAIKGNFPEAYLIAATPRRCVEVLEMNPHVDEIIPFDDRGEDHGWARKWQFIQKLRKLRIDQVYLFHPARKHAWLAFLAGARERIGYRTKHRSLFLTRGIEEQEGPVHDVQYFLDLLRHSGLRVDVDCAYEFYFSEEDRLKARSFLDQFGLDPGRLVAINPGANWAPKRWHPARFGELAHRLIEQYDVQIVLTGHQDDQPVVETILNLNGSSSIVSLCGKTSVRVLGALYAQCRLVISNDTGPLHIAAGVGSNVLGLFGPTASRETGPLGRGKNVIIHYFPEGAELPWIGDTEPPRWMESISVDLVLDTIEKEQLL